jgi:chemotaxis protein methyltransferase CheR
VIEEQFGLSFAVNRRDFLESRLRPRLEVLRLRRFIDYYLLLQYDLDSEVEHLAGLITNNETYFFRETYQFEGLFEEGLEHLKRESHDAPVRILCAGCSSGEEPYTLNIFARRAAQRRPGLRWAIDAFDIDLARLETARQAVYGAGSMRSATPELEAEYFDQVGVERHQLKAPFRQGVRFSGGNILDLGTFRQAQPYDSVFCRNVLIYFSEAAFLKAISNFAQVLRPGGLLFLGHSESLIGRSERFETVRLARCIAYRRVQD